MLIIASGAPASAGASLPVITLDYINHKHIGEIMSTETAEIRDYVSEDGAGKIYTRYTQVPGLEGVWEHEVSRTPFPGSKFADTTEQLSTSTTNKGYKYDTK